jgi:hypothetical protein
MPPYKCAIDINDRTRCLKFGYDPGTGRYIVPPGGTPCSCSECKYFLTLEEIEALKLQNLVVPFKPD